MGLHFAGLVFRNAWFQRKEMLVSDTLGFRQDLSPAFLATGF